MIQQKKELGWDFLFLGANIDAAKEACRFGIDRDFAVNYRCDPQGTRLNYESIDYAIQDVRASRPSSSSWKDKIISDVKKRGK